jgi:hypothetical protein
MNKTQRILLYVHVCSVGVVRRVHKMFDGFLRNVLETTRERYHGQAFADSTCTLLHVLRGKHRIPTWTHYVPDVTIWDALLAFVSAQIKAC